jgi:hypothetical protein
MGIKRWASKWRMTWRRNEQGDCYFFKANPSPMFANFEQYTGLPVAQRLAQLSAA